MLLPTLYNAIQHLALTLSAHFKIGDNGEVYYLEEGEALELIRPQIFNNRHNYNLAVALSAVSQDLGYYYVPARSRLRPGGSVDPKAGSLEVIYKILQDCPLSAVVAPLRPGSQGWFEPILPDEERASRCEDAYIIGFFSSKNRDLERGMGNLLSDDFYWPDIELSFADSDKDTLIEPRLVFSQAYKDPYIQTGLLVWQAVEAARIGESHSFSLAALLEHLKANFTYNQLTEEKPQSKRGFDPYPTTQQMGLPTPPLKS